MEPVSEDGGCNDIVNDYPQYLFYDSLQGTAVKVRASSLPSQATTRKVAR
jgi:hypothetical protein